MKNNTFLSNGNTWIILISISFAAFFTTCDIDDYDMSKLGRFDGLSIETEKKIISDYQKENPDLKLRDIFISAYYGTYNGVVFIEIALNNALGSADIAPTQNICIYGIQFIDWRIYTETWHNGQFFNPFSCELITLDILKTVADSYFGGWVECPHDYH